jgi:hypothetical protein
MRMKNFTRMMTLTIVCLLCASFGMNAATILSETFETSLGNFTTQSLKGDQSWSWNSSKYAKMTGYVNSVNNENDDWLISPPMDFSDVTKANLVFEHAHKYGVNPVTDLTLMVTDSYTGGAIDTSKWISIPFTHSDQTTWTFVNTGNLSLDAFKGKEAVRFAFRYKSTNTGCATWEIKNVVVESVVENVAKTVFEENFDKAVLGSLASPSTIEISTSADTIAKYIGTGWTGTKVYCAGGALKIGSSDKLGSVVTPAIDLSGASGNFSLYVDARAWSGDATSIKIYVNDVLATQIDGLSNAAGPYSCSTFGPYTLTGGTTATKIKIEGMQASKSRFLIDNLKITQGGAPVPTGKLSSETFTAETGTSVSKTIKLKAANITGNLAVACTNKKGNAFSITPAQITAAQANDTAGFLLTVYYAPTVVGADTATIAITGGGLSEAVNATVTGKAWTPVLVANLGALRAAFDANPTDFTTVYKVTGEVFVNLTTTNRNNKHVQDATGGILIDDLSGTVKAKVNVGDGIKNLIGNLAVYGKMLEIVPQVDVTLISTGNTITPTVVTIPEAKANLAKYESTLIQINNLTTNATGNFAKANYFFKNGSDSIVVRPNYADLPYIGTPIPTAAKNIKGILIQYNGTAQLVPRSLEDFEASSGLKPVTSDMKVYGKDGILNVVANNGQVIEVYNILGRKLLSTVAKDGINTFSLGRNQVILVKTSNMTSKVVL